MTNNLGFNPLPTFLLCKMVVVERNVGDDGFLIGVGNVNIFGIPIVKFLVKSWKLFGLQ